jgi:hypothetical protein
MSEWAGTGEFRLANPMTREGKGFYMNSDLTMADMRDGTSQTAMVSEIRTVRNIKDGRGILHYPENPIYHHNYTPNSLVPDDICTAWCTTTPEAPCVGAFAAWNQRRLTMTARSNHLGGVNLLLGDGSVRFVGETNNLDIWRALCTPRAAPGEVVVGDF